VLALGRTVGTGTGSLPVAALHLCGLGLALHLRGLGLLVTLELGLLESPVRPAKTHSLAQKAATPSLKAAPLASCGRGHQQTGRQTGQQNRQGEAAGWGCHVHFVLTGTWMKLLLNP
jgi:hypothetical protein